MTSKVDIVNIALTHLGAERVMSLDEASEPARTMLARWDTNRDAVLRAHPWNCAMVLTGIAASAVAPPHTWTYRYPLPADPVYLRMVEIEGDPDYAVVGGDIFTDAAPPLNISYVGRVDVSRFDALLAEVTGARLAWATAKKINDSRSLVNDMWGIYQQTLRAAKSVDAQEGCTDAADREDLGRGYLLDGRW